VGVPLLRCSVVGAGALEGGTHAERRRGAPEMGWPRPGRVAEKAHVSVPVPFLWLAGGGSLPGRRGTCGLAL